MTILTDSGLETVTYSQPLWQMIMNKNFQMLNNTLLKINALLDVDTQNLHHGAFLKWSVSTGKWEVHYK